MATNQATQLAPGTRVQLHADAIYARSTKDGTGIIRCVVHEDDYRADAPERGALYHIFVGEGFGFLGMGYTRNYADEFEVVATPESEAC